MKAPKSLTIRSRQLSFRQPKVMGILNATPDSFSDGGDFLDVNRAIDHIWYMLQQGADIIDIGGESTRPGSEPVPEKTELKRVIPILEKAISHFPEAIYSIDTTKYEVARQALELGVHIVNDVSGLQKEPRLASLCAEYGAGYILMHSLGDPLSMQQGPSYDNDDVNTALMEFFKDGISRLKSEGVESIIIDPGIGFGKTLKHNCSIIAGLQIFSKFGYPVLLGASRKSMIGGILNNRPVDGRLAGTLAVHYHSLINGASILRVHDVQETTDLIKVFNSLET